MLICKKILPLFLILTILFNSNVFSFYKAEGLENVPFSRQSMELIFKNVDYYFTDKKQGGYFNMMFGNGSVYSNNKNIEDYIYAINTIIIMVNFTKNTVYLNFVPKYLNFINKFHLLNSGFLSVENSNWSKNLSQYINLVDMSQLISMYSNLYALTNNASYLSEAMNLYNFIETYFYDSNYKNYFTSLDSNTLKYIDTIPKQTANYGILAQALFYLSEVTDNQTIFEKGVDLLNESLANSYNKDYRFFYPDLIGQTNQPNKSNVWIKINEQLDLASSFLQYAGSKELSQFNKTNYQNICIDIIDSIFSFLYYSWSQPMVIEGYLLFSQDSSTNSDVYLSFQCQLINFLLNYEDLFGLSNLNGYGSQESVVTFLNESSSNLLSFFEKELGLFMNRLNILGNRGQYNLTLPWVNYYTLSTILNLQEHSYNFTLNSSLINLNPQNKYSTISIFLIFIMISIMIALPILVVYHRLKNTKLSISKANGDFSNLNNSKQTPLNKSSINSCFNCGFILKKEDDFCSNCGYKIRKVTEEI